MGGVRASKGDSRRSVPGSAPYEKLFTELPSGEELDIRNLWSTIDLKIQFDFFGKYDP